MKITREGIKFENTFIINFDNKPTGIEIMKDSLPMTIEGGVFLGMPMRKGFFGKIKMCYKFYTYIKYFE